MIGRTIGRYRIDAELGRGGMGVVYRATQITLDRTVAIKMLSPQLAESGEHLARFRREAEVLARLQHENIVHIYDVEQVEGAFCIVMEYVAGPTLGAVLAREGALPPAAVREIGVQLTAGLDVAHRKGIVHRDLKPDNILFTPEGRPRITDFGIARIAGGDAMARTRTGVLMGTPYYMSPEQARGAEVTGASDLYSLGVLLYQLLSGRVPFHGSDPISLAIKHMQEPVPSLATTMPGLPGPLVALVARALEKEPHRRFGSAASMGAALRTLELEPAPPLAFGVPGDEGDAAAVVVCPECSFQVHAAFVTCPRCALPLRATGSGTGGREARGAVGHGAAAADGAASGVGAPEPGEIVAPPPLAGSVARQRGLEAVGKAVGELTHRWREIAEAVRWPASWPAGWRGWWPSGWDDWTRPRGRWGVPVVFWAGIVVVAAGVMLALLGDAQGRPGSAAGVGSDGSASGGAYGSGAAWGGGTWGASGSGGPGGQGTPAGGGAFPLPGGPTGPGQDGGSAPDGGVGSGGDVRPDEPGGAGGDRADGGGVGGAGGAGGADGGGGTGGTGGTGGAGGAGAAGDADRADGDGRAGAVGDAGAAGDADAAGGTDAGAGSDAGAAGTGAARSDEPPRGSADGEFIEVMDTGGRENLPRDFDIERARRELVGIVERQRRSTVAGDAAGFVRDLSPELALGAADILAQLHEEWGEIQSELWNLVIYFEDATRARTDFHTRLSGIRGGRGGRRVIQDTHVYWVLAHRGGRWVIIAATSGGHEGGGR